MKKSNIFKLIGLLVLLITISTFTGCASCSRGMKSLRSDLGGGLDRTVTVYDYNGNVLKEYSGKFDVEASETRVYFDMEDGRRVIIYNAIVINEEN